MGSWVTIASVPLLLEVESRLGCCITSEQAEYNKTLFIKAGRGLAQSQLALPTRSRGSHIG